MWSSLSISQLSFVLRLLVNHPPSLCTYAVCMCLMQVRRHRQSLTVYLTSPRPVFSSDTWKIIPVLWEAETSLVELLAVVNSIRLLRMGKPKWISVWEVINHLVLLKSDLFHKLKMSSPSLHAGHWDWKGKQSEIWARQEEWPDQGNCQDDAFLQQPNFDIWNPHPWILQNNAKRVLCLFIRSFRLTESSIHQWCILTTMGLSRAHSVKMKILSMFSSSCRLPFIENSYLQRLECMREVGITRDYSQFSWYHIVGCNKHSKVLCWGFTIVTTVWFTRVKFHVTSWQPLINALIHGGSMS